jgi:8-oxo-dGTP pyrophosphatase MutT (NUDIX family)
MPTDASSLLTEDAISRRLQDTPPDPELARLAAAYAGLRPAAVLVPLLWDEDRWRLLLTRRTETVQSHKGQVSFPGGAAEPFDDSPEATALREAQEEIGLRVQDARVLGRMAVRPTISSFLVTPIVARIPWPYQFRLSTNEVSRVFTVPLAWLAEAAHREERPHTTPGGIFERVIHYQSFDGEILWGATARITLDLLRVLGLV